MHIMTVCLGNICRSPAAEAVLNDKIDKAGLTGVTVSSAGTAGYHIGEPPHALTQDVGTERGYEFTTTATRLNPELVASADLILTMDGMNVADIHALADTDRVVRLGALARRQPGDIDDPYGQGRDAFEHMYDVIEDACDHLVALLAEDRIDEIWEVAE